MQPKPSSGRHCLGARSVLIRSNGHPFVKINLRCHDFEIFARGKIGIVVKNLDYLVQRKQRMFDTPVLAYFACACLLRLCLPTSPASVVMEIPRLAAGASWRGCG